MLPSDGNLEYVVIELVGDEIHCLVEDETVDFLDEVGVGSTSRGSHIEPVHRFKRWCFHFGRRRVDDTSRLAGWTRQWRCHWRVNLSPVDGPTFGTYPQREEALQAEVNWLSANVFGFVAESNDVN